MVEIVDKTNEWNFMALSYFRWIRWRSQLLAAKILFDSIYFIVLINSNIPSRRISQKVVDD